MKIPNGALDMVIPALDDLGANRLPLPISVRIHNASKAVRAAQTKRDLDKNALIVACLPDELKEVPGSEVKPDSPGFPELILKINELWNAAADVDAGAPIDLSKLNGLSDKVMCKPLTLKVLEDFGLLVSAPSSDLPAPPAELRIEP